MTVVLDCNIWVSLTINSQIDFIADLSDSGVVIASCTTLRKEITDVLSRPKLSKFISGSDVNKVVELHDLVTTSYPPGKIPHVVDDLKDNYLFALSAQSKADFLVTGDKLLLQVKKYRKTKIITLSDFKEIAR
jgi:putative PIN family toxin of toxin-antitoxin system